eukprot:5321540-Amphidinium_carterae.2
MLQKSKQREHKTGKRIVQQCARRTGKQTNSLFGSWNAIDGTDLVCADTLYSLAYVSTADIALSRNGATTADASEDAP